MNSTAASRSLLFILLSLCRAATITGLAATNGDVFQQLKIAFVTGNEMKVSFSRRYIVVGLCNVSPADAVGRYPYLLFSN